MESAQAVVLAMRKARVSPEEPMNRVRGPRLCLAFPPPLTVSFVRLGQRRQNRELRLGPHLICVDILLPRRPCPRCPTVMAGSCHPQVSGQSLERVSSDGQCSLVCILRPVTT